MSIDKRLDGEVACTDAEDGVVSEIDIFAGSEGTCAIAHAIRCGRSAIDAVGGVAGGISNTICAASDEGFG